MAKEEGEGGKISPPGIAVREGGVGEIGAATLFTFLPAAKPSGPRMVRVVVVVVVGGGPV